MRSPQGQQSGTKEGAHTSMDGRQDIQGSALSQLDLILLRTALEETASDGSSVAIELDGN